MVTEGRTLNSRDQVVVPSRATPAVPWSYTPSLNFGSGEEYFSDEPVEADFNFNGANITQVIPAFAKILGFSYVLEGAVSGTATISMRETVSKRELWNIFANLLRVSKLNANYDGKVLRVRSTSNIPVEVTMDTMNPNVEMGIFHLKSIPVKNVTSMLKNMLGRDLRSIELERNNTLVILDTSRTMPQLKQLIQELDHPIAENLSREIIVCRNISPKQIEAELKKILPILGFTVSNNLDASAVPGTITISSIDRLNLLIASAANPSALQELKQWVATLDDAESDQEQLYIYEVINSRADFLAKALAAMFTVSGSMVDTDANGKMTETGNIGTPGTMTANATVAPGSVFDVPVRLWADNSSNRLAIRTRPRTYATIKAYLERLDTIPSAVLLQVMVFEVTLTDSMQFGMEFNTQNAIDNW